MAWSTLTKDVVQLEISDLEISFGNAKIWEAKMEKGCWKRHMSPMWLQDQPRR